MQNHALLLNTWPISLILPLQKSRNVLESVPCCFKPVSFPDLLLPLPKDNEQKLAALSSCYMSPYFLMTCQFHLMQNIFQLSFLSVQTCLLQLVLQRCSHHQLSDLKLILTTLVLWSIQTNIGNSCKQVSTFLQVLFLILYHKLFFFAFEVNQGNRIRAFKISNYEDEAFLKLM